MHVESTGLGLEAPDGARAEIRALALWAISHLASFLLACPLFPFHYSLFSLSVSPLLGLFLLPSLSQSISGGPLGFKREQERSSHLLIINYSPEGHGRNVSEVLAASEVLSHSLEVHLKF